MIVSKKRAVALIAAAAAVLPLVVASPASAGTSCHLVLAGPTPSAEVDTNNDGNPEVRVPSVSNVELCVGADIVLTDQPQFWSEPCGEWGSCTRFFVHYGLAGYAETDVQLCYEVDDAQLCHRHLGFRAPLDFLAGGTMCFGYDLAGEYPCSGQMIAFE